jgi:C1A family cysteine protease
MPKPIVDLRPLCPPVDDQGDLATDSACALCSALEILEKKAAKPSIRLSRLFLYYNQRDIENTVESDNGASISSGLRALAKLGCCSEESWPYNSLNFATLPSDACYLEALLHRIASSEKLDSLDQMRSSLASGFPVVFSMTVYESFQSPQVEKTGIVEMPGPGEQYYGSTAMLAVGYNDSLKRLIVRNSVGAAWGQTGYFTLPYDYASARDMANNIWVMRL